MKLVEKQIEDLFVFVRKHYVEYYDLQTELVDHLANGIEQQWKQNSKLTFEEAKQKEFKKFGIFGFADVIAARKKAMSKKYSAIIWAYFKEWWSFPKIVGTISAVLVIFVLLQKLPSGDLKLGVIYGLFIALSLLMFYRSFQLKRNIEGLSRKWMLQEKIYEQWAVVQLFCLPVYFFNLMRKANFFDNIYGLFAIAFLLVCMLLVYRIIGYVIPQKAEELMAETYPEYKIS